MPAPVPSSAPALGWLLRGHGCRLGPDPGAVLAGMFGLPRPWYFPFQKSYWLGNGRVETWEWTWPWSHTTRLSIMEEDQACAMESRRLGEGRWVVWGGPGSAAGSCVDPCVPLWPWQGRVLGQALLPVVREGGRW